MARSQVSVSPEQFAEMLAQLDRAFQAGLNPELWRGVQSVIVLRIAAAFAENGPGWAGWRQPYAKWRLKSGYPADGKILRLGGNLADALLQNNLNTVTGDGERGERITVRKTLTKNRFTFAVNYQNPRSGLNVAQVIQKSWTPQRPSGEPILSRSGTPIRVRGRPFMPTATPDFIAEIESRARFYINVKMRQVMSRARRGGRGRSARRRR